MSLREKANRAIEAESAYDADPCVPTLEAMTDQRKSFAAEATPAAVLALYAELDEKDVGLANLREEVLRLLTERGIVVEQGAEIESLRAALREAQQDTKRLDWFESLEDGFLEQRDEETGERKTLWWRMPSHLRGRYVNSRDLPIREAIDAARGVTP